MTGKVIRVEYTIEPSWTHDHHTSEIEIPVEDLAGLAGTERYAKIERYVEEAVNNECSWGFSELPGEHEEGSGDGDGG